MQPFPSITIPVLVGEGVSGMGLLSAPAPVVLALLPWARERTHGKSASTTENSGSSGASFGAKHLRVFNTICGMTAGANKHTHRLRSVPVNVTASGCSQILHYMWATAVPVWGPRDATLSLWASFQLTALQPGNLETRKPGCCLGSSG